jgi:preprotein translocase subunit SecE
MSQQRFVILAFVVAALLSGIVTQSAIVATVDFFAWTDRRLLGLVNASVATAVVVTVATFFGLLRNQQAVKFTDEVVGELRKVTWPSREETVRATTTVILTTLFVAALIGLYDLLWKNVADLFLFTEG